MTQIVTFDAKPESIAIDPAKTAVIVVDMQNDFGSKGGMFDRAAIDISGIQRAVAPTARVPTHGHQDHLPKDGLSVRPFGPELLSNLVYAS
jgi:ureidoacrylate peracid hydrolase